MRAFISKHKLVLIFTAFAVTVGLFFQNCSPSLLLLGLDKQAEAAKAKTDFTEIIRKSDDELDRTKQTMKSRHQLTSHSVKSSRYTASGRVSSPSKGMAIRLVRKAPVRRIKRSSAALPMKKNVAKRNKIKSTKKPKLIGDNTDK